MSELLPSAPVRRQRRQHRLRRLREPALLAAGLAAPLLPAPFSFLLLLGGALLWLALRPRPPRREAAVGLLLAAVALAALAGDTAARLESRLSDRRWLAHRAGDYGRLWKGLRGEAAAAARALRQLPGSPLPALDHPPEAPPPATAAAQGATLAAFEALGRLATREPEERERRHALLLVDRDGNPVAWAGEGLIQEPEQWPRSGLAYRAGFNSVTLFAAEPLDDSYRPWRVVAGASFPTRRLPRPLAVPAHGWAALQPAALLEQLHAAGDRAADALLPARPLRWSLADNPAQTHPGALEVRLSGAPALEVERLAAAIPAATWPARLAWAGLAVALLALAVMRGVGVALPAVSTLSAPPERAGRVAALVLGGLFAAAELAGVAAQPLLAMEAGVGLALLGLAAPRRRPGSGLSALRDSGGWVVAGGALAMAALFAAAWAAQLASGPFDAAEELMVPPGDWCVRLAWSGAAFGLLALAGRRESAAGSPAGDRWLILAVGLLVGGAALSNTPWAAVPLLAAGGGCAARFGDRQRRGQAATLAAMVVLAALAGAAVWETAYRARLASYDFGELLDRLAPPAAADLAVFSRRLETHFRRLDVDSLAARSPVGLDSRDLAYSLWRASPLAAPNALSALVVRAGNTLVSSFSFGVPVDGDGNADAQQLAALELPGWKAIGGEVDLNLGGGRQGVARYWLVPRPGFAVGDRRRLAHLEASLLRGSAPTAAPAEELAAPALFALYTLPDGMAALSPWPERPPLAGRLRATHAVTAAVSTPSGRARAYVRPLPGGAAWEAVYLPGESPLAAIERSANWAVGLLLLLACAAPPAALLALPRAAFRDLLRRTVRSYSRRLLIVYTALLLLPLLALNALLVRSVENDMARGQLVYGEAALSSAERLLEEQIRNLPLGFVFDPGTFDPKLTAIAEVVHRPVNLYGRSRLSASSEHELFTAGLLPTRLPGEVYSSLTLGERNLYSLVNHAAEVPYLELYAPLRLAGDDPRAEPRLFVSVPLLAQQEEGLRQLAHLRRHAILATAVLFALLAAVGTRLAQNFTRPITQLVEGTRRIAAGARSLDLAPTELELAALVAAVDDMARRIAEGREKLLREKQVVERVVQNIASGVVSLDAERRILMHNRVAAELLGVGVGQSLERLVARGERLAPVAAFLRAAGGEMARATVRLGGTSAGEREWSLVWVPLAGQGDPAALLVVEDVTEELRGQRLLAWAAMARMIAHEIKNPLTPIRLSAEHMREVYRRDPERFDAVFERCTANILTQVEELRSIASEFSTYSAIPRIEPRPGDLTATVGELVEGYRAAPPHGVSVELETPDGAIAARFDAKLLSRAVRNLIENALRASAGGGRVLVRVERVPGAADGAAVGAASAVAARIAVLDHGPGVQPDLLARIFDPYFSTHDSGTGLGLPIARRIAEEHGGTIEAHNRPQGGLEAVITIPCEPAG
jgi:signal transduction histidine kinase